MNSSLIIGVASGWFLVVVMTLQIPAAEEETVDEEVLNVEQLIQAQKLVNEGNFSSAIDILKEILKRDPTIADVHLLLGHAYFELGRYGEARQAFIEAVGLGRLTTEVISRMVIIDQELGNDMPRLSALRLLTLLDPENRPWQLLSAELVAAYGYSDEATSIYREILAEKPDDADTLIRLGNLYLEDGKSQEAALAFQKAYHLGSSKTELPRMIGELWYKLGNLREAVLWYDRALAYEKDDAQSLQLRQAQMLLMLSDYDHARRLASSLVESSDSKISIEAQLIICQIAMKNEERSEVIKQLERAVELGVDDTQVYLYLGNHYYLMENYESAARYLLKHTEEQIRNPTIHRNLIISLINLHEEENARKYLKQYLAFYGLDKSAKQLIQLLIKEFKS